MVNGLYDHLGRDDELRQALKEQQDALSALAAQNAANAQGYRLTKHDALRIGIVVMALMFLFK